MSMYSQRAIALLLATLLLPSLAAAAGANGYRLAGVLAVGPEYLGHPGVARRRPAAGPQGQQPRGRRAVVLVDAQRLRIALSGRTIELNLDGSGAPAQVPVALGVVQEQTDNDRVLVRSLDTEALSAALARPPKAKDGVAPSSQVKKIRPRKPAGDSLQSSTCRPIRASSWSTSSQSARRTRPSA